MAPTLAANSKNTRRSSLSVSSTPSSSSSYLNQSGNWPPPSPHRQTQFGGFSSSSSLPPPRVPSSTSTSTMTTTKPADSIAAPTPTNPLTSLQKTFLQIQPHLDKARYKAEAGLSKRGFVRDGLRTRVGSGGVNGEGEQEEDGLEDGLEGLMGGGSSDAGGGGGGAKNNQTRWRAQDVDRVYDREVDQDSGWTGSERMSHHRTQRQFSDGDEEDRGVGGLEKDNLKWPVGTGEGWKPL